MYSEIHVIRVMGIIGKSEYVSYDLDEAGGRVEVSRYPFDPQAVPIDLNDILQEGFARGKRRVILDMGDIPWINSKGLGTLVMLFHAVRNQGGALVLARPVPEVVKLIETASLDKVFPIFGTVPEAKEHLKVKAASEVG